MTTGHLADCRNVAIFKLLKYGKVYAVIEKDYSDILPTNKKEEEELENGVQSIYRQQQLQQKKEEEKRKSKSLILEIMCNPVSFSPCVVYIRAHHHCLPVLLTYTSFQKHVSFVTISP